MNDTDRPSEPPSNPATQDKKSPKVNPLLVWLLELVLLCLPPFGALILFVALFQFKEPMGEFVVFLTMITLTATYICYMKIKKTAGYAQWYENLTGIKLPTAAEIEAEHNKLTPEQKTFREHLALGLAFAFLVASYIGTLATHASELEVWHVVVSLVELAVILAGVLIGLKHPVFYEKYGGALCGLALASASVIATAPFWFVLLFTPASIYIGHVIGKWWQKQPWVIEARLKNRTEEQAKQQEKIKSEDAKLAEARPKSAQPTPSVIAQQIADELMRKQ